MLSHFLNRLSAGHPLSEAESLEAVRLLFEQTISENEIIELLVAMSSVGITVDELVGFSKGLRACMRHVPIAPPLLDVCGTGGSGKPRFNISTAAAFVLASGGVRVAKHGNRGSTSQTGSFDFLEALHIPFDLSNDEVAHSLSTFNCCFLFARNFHPAVAKVASARAKCPAPTIFNYLGPLSNPALVSYQILGTTSSHMADLLAQALLRLGLARAIVFSSLDGRDELSPLSPAVMFEVNKDHIEKSLFDPRDVLTVTFSEDALSGGLATDNAALFLKLMSAGDTSHAISQWIALNAGVGFYVVGAVPDIKSGYQNALKLIEGNHVFSLLTAMGAH